MNDFLCFHHPPFHLVLQILCNEFLNPKQFFISPALRMEGEHYPGGEIACFNGHDDVGGGVVAAAQEIGIGDRAGGHSLVAEAHFVAVPAAAGVGEVEGFVEIDVEIGLRGDAQRAVIVFFPDGAAVPFAQGAAVHADGGDMCELSYFFQVPAE